MTEWQSNYENDFLISCGHRSRERKYHERLIGQISSWPRQMASHMTKLNNPCGGGGMPCKQYICLRTEGSFWFYAHSQLHQRTVLHRGSSTQSAFLIINVRVHWMILRANSVRRLHIPCRSPQEQGAKTNKCGTLSSTNCHVTRGDRRKWEGPKGCCFFSVEVLLYKGYGNQRKKTTWAATTFLYHKSTDKAV